MKDKGSRKPLFFGFFILILILITVIYAANRGATNPGEYDAFAQCIVDSGAKMYSAWWCGHCQEQKKDFGNSFKIIEANGGHVECSPGGSKVISDFCKSQGVTGTPSWILKNGTLLRGRQNLFVLAQKTRCTDTIIKQ